MRIPVAATSHHTRASLSALAAALSLSVGACSEPTTSTLAPRGSHLAAVKFWEAGALRGIRRRATSSRPAAAAHRARRLAPSRTSRSPNTTPSLPPRSRRMAVITHLRLAPPRALR
jgi:hypothetical protein